MIRSVSRACSSVVDFTGLALQRGQGELVCLAPAPRSPASPCGPPSTTRSTAPSPTPAPTARSSAPALERSVFARGGSFEDRARAFAGTVCLSSDTGHAVHPNYAERHDPTHHPRVNGGPILKVNVNNRYAHGRFGPRGVRRSL
jgi:aspartyl aminopeptidase